MYLLRYTYLIYKIVYVQVVVDVVNTYWAIIGLQKNVGPWNVSFEYTYLICKVVNVQVVVDVVNTYWAIIGLPKNVGSPPQKTQVQ